MRVLEDLHVVENRGSGINLMLDAMRSANLAPPKFEDKRNSFRVIFYNHTLLSPESISWLNQYAAYPLNDRQRLALVFLRQRERITNKVYQTLNRVDAQSAYRELRGLVDVELVQPHNTGRWTYYTLNIPDIVATTFAETPEERVLQYVREHGYITRGTLMRLLGYREGQAKWLLLKMQPEHLQSVGAGKGTRYVLP